MLAIGKNLVAFAGKTNVYFRSLEVKSDAKNGSAQEKVPDLQLAGNWTDKDTHVECIAISSDDTLIAVADSLHKIFLFEKKLNDEGSLEWGLLFSRESSKRIIKLQFTSDGQYLVYLDKQSDIFAIQMSPCRQNFSATKKIMGHTSFLSDFVIRMESKQIISCDRDEKIRISNFPDSFLIQGFKLGHMEAVVGVSVINSSSGGSSVDKENGSPPTTYLLSVSVAGILMLWYLKENVSGTETDVIKQWNVKDLLPETYKDSEVQAMKAVSNAKSASVAVTFVGSTKVFVFNVDIPERKLELRKELEADSDLILFDWSKTSEDSSGNRKMMLICYIPQLPSIRFWQSQNSSLEQLDEFSEEMAGDIKASAESLKPSVAPMRKRHTVEDSPLLKKEGHAKKIKA